MEIHYMPGIGFEMLSQSIQWGEQRESIRRKLQNKHKDDDRITDLSHVFDGDESHNIHQRRDIYTNSNSGENYFFLNYDTEHKFNEIEVHWGFDVIVNGVKLQFNKDISHAVTELKKTSASVSEIEPGNFLFHDLKMVIASSEAMGGDGDGLSYFYAAKDISHLIE